MPLPKSIAPPGSIPLPPEQDTLLAQNYQLLSPLKPPPQVEETEDDNDEANPSLTPNPANPNPAYSQDQRGNEQQLAQQQGQRVSFQLNAVAAAAAKRPRMTMDQLNMG
jgi:transcription initiation factor TFIID subunit 9B